MVIFGVVESGEMLDFFNVLSKCVPKWLFELNTSETLILQGICGWKRYAWFAIEHLF